VSLLKRHGITKIAINLQQNPWTVVHRLGIGRRWGVDIHYSLEEMPLGSAGAAKRLEWYLDECFIVFDGDACIEMDLSGLMEAHRQGGALVTMTLHSVENPGNRSIVELNAESRVHRIVERHSPSRVSSHLVNAGIFVSEPEIFSWLPANQHVDFDPSVFSQILASGLPIIGYPVTDSLNHTDILDDSQEPNGRRRTAPLLVPRRTLRPTTFRK
jgi:mannose-1-phosphate guanylyltransferase/phosphomannomutase